MVIFKGFRGLLEEFWGQKAESIEQNGIFSAQCLVISVSFRNYVPTQCYIRRDVVPDASRRSVKYVPTHLQVHPNAISSTCERSFKYFFVKFK